MSDAKKQNEFLYKMSTTLRGGLLEAQAKQVNATLLIVTHDGRLKNHFHNQIQL